MPGLKANIRYPNKYLLLLPLITLLPACFQKNDTADKQLENRFRAVDSLVVAGKSDTARSVLVSTRYQIDNANPLICTYYNLYATHFCKDTTERSVYADSCLAFFSNESVAKKYPDAYFKALITKGDALLQSGKYIAALNYYYDGKRILPPGSCDDGDLAGKVGFIYFEQKNFMLAGKFWGDSYRKLNMCNAHVILQKQFFFEQGALNNAGFSYESAGQLDSASYYYELDNKLINETDSNKLIDKSYINAAHSIVYDNLGSLYLKRGNLKIAHDYLTKSIALNANSTDGVRIPPYIKLSTLYLQKGDNDSAAYAFEQSRLLIHKFLKANIESAILWNKLYAQYLFKLNKPADAFRYQSAYIRMRDSVNKGMSDLYRLNVVSELNGIQQKQMVAELQQKSKIRTVYLASISVTVLLSVVIIILINRSLKRTQKSHQDTTKQNIKLQSTLTELELVNKNYMRVMRVMAHDLRNPLAGITGLSRALLEDNDFTDESKYMIKLIETTGMHSLEMINQLLKTGLADENEKIEMQKSDIQSLIYDSVELLRFKAREKQQEILFEGDNEPIIIDVNYEKIWQVINNLIVNAIKFSHTGGTIKVSIQLLAKHILIAVADNGIGISPQKKESVFEMFTPDKKTGTDGEQAFGLGLSISKKIIEMHKGRIWFEPNTPAGTVFYVELPYSG